MSSRAKLENLKGEGTLVSHKAKSTRRVGVFMIVALGYFGAATVSIAQSASADATARPSAGTETASGGAYQLEEIIVTAQKRSENLQDVPVSVQVISGQILNDQNYVSLAGLTQTVPGVHV